MANTAIKPFIFTDSVANFVNSVFNLLDGEPGVEGKATGVIAPKYYHRVIGDDLNIMVELVGVPKEDISCTIDKGNFTLAATREVFGEKISYKLDLTISPEFDGDKAKIVSYKDGLLTISVPKKVKTVNEPRKLTIG